MFGVAENERFGRRTVVGVKPTADVVTVGNDSVGLCDVFLLRNTVLQIVISMCSAYARERVRHIREEEGTSVCKRAVLAEYPRIQSLDICLLHRMEHGHEGT